MHLRSATLLALALCGLWLLHCTSGGLVDGDPGGSASEVVGKLVARNGMPVDSAVVCLVPKSADTVGNTFASDSVATDDTGGYTFKRPSAGDYVVYGTYHDSELIVRVPEFHYDSTVLKVKDLGTDTMLAPGKISGKVIADTSDLNGIRCYVPGTSFIAYTNGVGAFVMTGILPGTYTVRFEFTGYLPDSVAGVIVVSGDTAKLSPVTLRYDPQLAPPRPTDLTHSYDAASGVVTLSWQPVTVSDLAGYHVYLSTGNGTLVLLTPGELAVASYRDTVFDDLTDPVSRQRIYMVRAVDNDLTESVNSKLDTVMAASPTLVRTVFDSCWVLKTGANIDPDSVKLQDTVTIVIHFANPTRGNTWIEWAENTTFSPLAKKTDLTRRGSPLSGYDTLRQSWSVAGSHNLYLRAFDATGRAWVDSSYNVNVVVGNVVPHDKWEALDSLTKGRWSTAACELDGKVYAMGGVWVQQPGAQERVLKTLEVHNPAADRWDTLASCPSARKWHSMAAAQGKLFVFGGTGYVTSVRMGEDFSSVEEYNPSTNSWRTLATRMPDTLLWTAAANVGEKIYVIGGRAGVDAQSTIYEFNPSTGQWTLRGNLSTPRAGHQAVALNGLIYIAGGVTNLNSTISSVEVFDPATGDVSETDPLATPRFNFGLAALGGTIFAVGGAAGSGTAFSVLNSVESYDPSTQQWQTVRPMTRGRWGIGCVGSGGRVFAIGGTSQANQTAPVYETRQVEVYYP